MIPRRAVRAALALITAAGVLSAAPTAAASPALSEAKKQAAALAAQVNRLGDQAEVASEDFDQAQEQLGKATNEYLVVQSQLEAAEADDASTKARISSQATALYEAGGPVPLYAAALDGQDLGDVVDRFTMAGSVLNGTKLAARHNAGQTAKLARLNASLAAAASKSSGLRANAALHADRVRSLLAEQQHLLDAANGQVRAITVELQEKAQRDAAAKAAVQLAQAQAAAALSTAVLDTAGAPTPAAGYAILAAESRIGTPYIWGATGPGSFDCSGLTSWAYGQAGIPLPRTSREQWYMGHHVALADLQPGDLLFWALDPNNPATIHHVAIYAGNGRMIAAPHSGAAVSLQAVYLNGFAGATRPTG